jgi:peptidyl-tRNA hydrolase, PTH1 family
MKLIAGLGNVGPQYARTRHNIGFMVADRLAENLGATWKPEPKLQADVVTAQIASPDNSSSERVVLAKPHTMMNLSGEAVQRLIQHYKLTPSDVWVIFDDVDTPFGKLRLRQGGSAGGHQGVASIMRHAGDGFVRVRLGISLNDRTNEPSEVYVLRPFNEDEQAQLPALIDNASSTILGQIQTAPVNETTISLLD